MTTTKKQMTRALIKGDSLEDLVCYVQDQREENPFGESPPIPLACVSGVNLPEREYNAGYGGVEGEPCICFSERAVYIKQVYDGSESFVAIPRHPRHVKLLGIPQVGGG